MALSFEPMKRHIFTLLLTLCVALVVAAQNPADTTTKNPSVFDSVVEALVDNWKIPNLDCKHEIRIGCPLDLSESFNGEPTIVTRHPTTATDEFLQAKEKVGQRYYYSSPSISYSYRLNRSLEFTARALFMGTSLRSYSTLTGEVMQSQSMKGFHLTPGLRWNFILGSKARYYVGLGYDLALENKNSRFTPTADVCYEVGFTLGAKLFFFGESLVSGEGSFLGLMGVGYRF